MSWSNPRISSRLTCTCLFSSCLVSLAGSRVGICFTVFSTLSNYSPLHKPYHPPPFTTALLYGSAAGIFGMVALHPFESKVPLMEMLAKGGGGTIGRGAVAVGLVISVQNMLVREVLRNR